MHTNMSACGGSGSGDDDNNKWYPRLVTFWLQQKKMF